MFRLSSVLFSFCCISVGLGSNCSENAEIHNGLQNMLDLEATYLNHLELYLDKALQEQLDIHRFLEHVKTQHEMMQEREEYFGNPLNALTTINRFVNNWKYEVTDVILSDQTFKQYNQSLSDELDSNNLQKPTSSNLLDAVRDVLEMQETDELATSKLAKEAILVDEDTGQNVTLSASDCYTLGRSLYQLQHYNYASEWLQQALQRLQVDVESFPSIDKVQLLEELTQSLQKHGSHKLAYKLNNDILKSQPTHEAALKNKIVLENELALERFKLSHLM